MFYCLDCNAEFEHPTLVDEWQGDMENGGYVYHDECPNCRSDDIEKMEHCPFCEEYIKPTQDCCDRCLKDLTDDLGIIKTKFCDSKNDVLQNLIVEIMEGWQ